MTRSVLLALCAISISLAGCADADAPPATALEDPVIDTATELASDGGLPPETEEIEGFNFRIDGDAGPAASYALDEGAECLVYGAHIVRLTPVEDGEGHRIDLIARPDGASPFDLCSAEATVDVPTRAGVDTFVALDGSVLWTTRDSRGRDLLTGFDLDTDEEVFSELVTTPVVKDADGVVYGGPPEVMESPDALAAAGVTCPEADAWFAEERPVAISRRLRFSFESSETADAGDALCFVLEDA